MKKRSGWLALAWIVAAGGWTGAALGDDSANACGAVLCLAAGGSGGSECQNYIAGFFAIVGTDPADTVNRRRDFLNSCGGSDAGFNNTAASYAESCQPETLAGSLNAELQNCFALQNLCWTDGGSECMACTPNPGQAQALCGAWFNTPVVQVKAPELVGNCAAGTCTWQVVR